MGACVISNVTLRALKELCRLGSESTFFRQTVMANGKEKGLRGETEARICRKCQLVPEKGVSTSQVPFPFLIRLEEVIVRSRPA